MSLARLLCNLFNVTICRVRFKGKTYDLLGLLFAIEGAAAKDGYYDTVEAIRHVRGYIHGFQLSGTLEE